MRLDGRLLAWGLVAACGCGDDTADGAGGGSTSSNTTTSTTSSTGSGAGGEGVGGGAGGTGGAAPECTDGVKDGSESDVDCGGACAGCDVGKTCVVPQDCASGACTGGACARWGRWYGASFALDVQPHPQGGMVVGANFSGTIDGDGFPGPIVGQGGLDALVVRYAANGDVVFAKRIGGVAPENQTGVAVGPDGSIVVTAICNGPIDLDGNAIGPCGAQDVLVVKLSAQGDFVWGKTFGTATGTEVPFGRGVDAAGNVYVSGFFDPNGGVGTPFSVGSDVLISVGGSDAFVFKLDPSGAPLWAKRFGSAEADGFHRLVVDPGGGVLVLADYHAGADFGAGPLPSAGGTDGAIVSIDAAGATRWSASWGGAGDESGGSIASDSAGNALVFAPFQGSIAFGATQLASAGEGDFAVAKLSAADGSVAWVHGFGGTGMDADGGGVACTPEDDVVIGMQVQSPTIDLGGGPVTTQGAGDAFVARLSGSTGAHQHSEAIGSPDTERIFDVAVDPASGNVFVSGTLYGTLVIGADTLTADMGPDCYAASLGRLSPP